GYTYAYNNPKLSSPTAKKDDTTAGTSADTSEGSKSTKTTVSDGLKKRLDWLFINTIDKDSDEKVSEAEFNDWAKSYALILAEEIILSNQLGAPNASANPNNKQMQQRLQQLQRQMQAFAKAMARRKG